jgi:hypothetical protein
LLAVSGEQCSQRKASSYFRVHRSTLRYRPKFPSVKKETINNAIVDLSIEHPELGSDKVGRLVKNRGLRISSERVRKVRREESLQVPPPKKKQSRLAYPVDHCADYGGCFLAMEWSWLRVQWDRLFVVVP